MNQVSERVTAKRAQKGRRVLTSARGGGSKDNKAASWRCHGVLEKVTAKTGNSAGPRQVRSGPSVSTSGRRGSRRRGAWRRSVRVKYLRETIFVFKTKSAVNLSGCLLRLCSRVN